MLKRMLCVVTVGMALLSGCASVPMAPKEHDFEVKTFQAPPHDKSAVYVYRNSLVGQALKRAVSIDGQVIGETANKTYFYRLLSPGTHTLSTESEFGDNSISLDAKAGETYFVRQSIKMGVFVGGAKLELVPASEGRENVLKCELALSTQNSRSGTAAAPASSIAPRVPAVGHAEQRAASTVSPGSKEQQLDELARTPGMSYEEYQRRYQQIMAQ